MSDPVAKALDLAAQDGPIHVGAIKGEHGGRTDNIPMRVPANAYVLPADVVSGLPQAEGNTDAGHRILDELFKQGPYHSVKGSTPYGSSLSGPYGTTAHASGGAAHGRGSTIPVIVAGGEYIIAPEHVARIGGGDVKDGHKVLDAYVKSIREKNIKTLRKLPGPVKN